MIWNWQQYTFKNSKFINQTLEQMLEFLKRTYLINNYVCQEEPNTPWLFDTAKHYQWYPFINIGHYN
jgi:hypothetical protein